MTQLAYDEIKRLTREQMDELIEMAKALSRPESEHGPSGD